MRRWRVGTISMGATLMLLGVVLMCSQLFDWEVSSLAFTWWPAILIVLGVEVLVYIFTSKQEKPVVHYDFLSIVFIGFLGTIGIGLFLMSSVGLVDEVKGAIHSETTQGALPKVEQQVTSNVNKIVVQAGHNDVELTTNTSDSIHLFGSFESSFLKKGELEAEDIVQVTNAGNTMYIQLLQGPKRNGIQYEHTRFHRTLSLPVDIPVEVQQPPNDLSVSIDTLEADWEIEHTSQAVVDLGESVNASVRVESFNEQVGWDVQWDKEKQIEADQSEQTLYYKEKQYGDGEHTIQFNEVDRFTIEQVGTRK
ncbi:LiaI-LiaF-like domain-containing protein [Pontibacillus yanchengensis]|uniref:LiaI-LiaF-like transmembrane region domain-containing protein n=1 Tax=Pontibacillus yanchengensis Y32 TaxID=1385514 RepID=A0A0A2TCF2_9BACI|nr:DUF5668 domain-containing protein [Pontibacillus yanchengensis]KGP72103.1 hypothetical protein N782_14115 [Pontibacillus yanchengensis Y32]